MGSPARHTLTMDESGPFASGYIDTAVKALEPNTQDMLHIVHAGRPATQCTKGERGQHLRGCESMLVPDLRTEVCRMHGNPNPKVPAIAWASWVRRPALERKGGCMVEVGGKGHRILVPLPSPRIETGMVALLDTQVHRLSRGGEADDTENANGRRGN